jgi:hypothetical protein
MDRILLVCHKKFGNTPDKYGITQPGGALITAETWQRYFSAHTPVVDIVIRLFPDRPPKSAKHRKRIKDAGQSRTRRTFARSTTSLSSSDIDSVFQDDEDLAQDKLHRGESDASEDSLEAAEQSSVPSQGVSRPSSTISTSKDGVSPPVREEITWRKTPPFSQALIVHSTKALEERVQSRESDEEILVRVPDDNLLATVRPRPPIYSPSPKMPPPNRKPRYMMSLPEDLVTNVPFVDIPQELYEDIYFQATGHRNPNSAQLVRTKLHVKNEVDSSSVKKTDTESRQNEKDHGIGKEPPSTQAHSSAMPKRVPPLFLWPTHAPLRHSPIHEVPSNQDDTQASGTQDMNNKKHSPDEADSKVSRDSTDSSHESLVAVLNHIHTSMSSDEDYDMIHLAEEKFNSRKFYKSLPELSRPDVQGEINKIISHSDPQPPNLFTDHLKSWHAHILELHLDLESIFAFFAPLQQVGTALHKYWGSEARLVQVNSVF